MATDSRVLGRFNKGSYFQKQLLVYISPACGKSNCCCTKKLKIETAEIESSELAGWKTAIGDNAAGDPSCPPQPAPTTNASQANLVQGTLLEHPIDAA